MHPHLRLTPDEHRLIRNWAFAMAIIYSSLMLAFFALVTVGTNSQPAAPSAATAMQQDASPNTQAAGAQR
jgi:hypothetical protein